LPLLIGLFTYNKFKYNLLRFVAVAPLNHNVRRYVALAQSRRVAVARRAPYRTQ
jgi:hypothetical protein